MPNVSKGVRIANQELIRLMRIDRNNGLTWDELAVKYGKDKSNIRKMVLGIKRK